MTNLKSILSLGLLASMSVTAAPAQAQPSDLDPKAVAAATRYALPIAFDSYMQRCSVVLDSQGYASTNAPQLRDKFGDGQDEAWPSAKQAMLSIMAEEAGDMSMFEMLGDDALRPFVDGLIGGLVLEEIKTDQCGDIERGLEILDPLPAENVAQLVGFFVEMGQRGDEEAATGVVPQ